MAKPRKKQNQRIGYLVLAGGVGLLLAVMVIGLVRQGVGPAALQGVGMAGSLKEQWQSDFNGFHAVFQTQDNTFQILAIQKSGNRYFSRGRYTLDGNMILLVPDDALGEPEAKDPSQKFTKLTYGTYGVELSHNGGNLVWRSAPVDPQRAAVDPRHPLIQYSGADSITWTPKK